MPINRPDPFTEEERDNLLAYFRAKVPFYFPFLHVLFWTGMRPSEALALLWGDVDLRNGYISITKSRTLDAEGSRLAQQQHSAKMLQECRPVEHPCEEFERVHRCIQHLYARAQGFVR
ncbi:MAG: tyrosine-type recombinase/integrase [Planctomycetes bacterium]|nr:tyrosine-type recombinase/integrase [Planctomycetota bacterium]